MLKRTLTVLSLGLTIAANGALADNTVAPHRKAEAQAEHSQAATSGANQTRETTKPATANDRNSTKGSTSKRDSLYGADPKDPYHELTNHSN